MRGLVANMVKATRSAKRTCKTPYRHQHNVTTISKQLSRTLTKKIVKKIAPKSKVKIVAIVERIAKINKKGVSDFISIEPRDLKKRGCKPQEVDMFKSNNGVPYLRKDAPLSRRYSIERKYNKNNGSLMGFKLIGFNNNLYFSRSIPQDVRRATLEKYGHKCIWCGSTDRLEVDHKNGRYNCVSNNVNDFQILCKSCNDKKRERCKKCQLSGQRFNVQTAISPHLYKRPFTCGTGKFNEKIGCKGCFLYDIEDFYMKHDGCRGKQKHKTDVDEHEVQVVIKKKGRVIYQHKSKIS